MTKRSYTETGRTLLPREVYLSWGNRQPRVENLQDVIKGMKRGLNDPNTRLACGGALLDLAMHPGLLKKQRPQFVDQAAEKLQPLVDARLESVDPHRISSWLGAAVYLAYLPMYARAAAHEQSCLEDVSHVRASLLGAGAQTIDLLHDEPESAEDTDAFRLVRARQLRMGAHLVHTRFLLRHEAMLLHARPALPREEIEANPKKRQWGNWTIGFSQVGFLDNTELDRVHLVSTAATHAYQTSILVLSGRDDLGLQSAGEIIAASHMEGDQTVPGVIRNHVTDNLNRIEEALYTRLGWRFEGS